MKTVLMDWYKQSRHGWRSISVDMFSSAPLSILLGLSMLTLAPAS